mmetsp:Transcript_75465/g.157381  ORF Transcript_75465/g.157381 Transcript_75465/m.157381 type:complete len:696 (-) Transcript_75465:164-2251(-)|eukprot:CAMPEP_0206428268 /NCGR_PEP_ID=MMETSP0324_2-20121206/5548_1 /ASSEMBLY_ACC=CAM_ASM_000836 /TAXON_ID=2866 /ORGANISM="Crypthecodinium cohnii, Strain Seligo" /LENGTH=695 /DNA_ID=CAMNT_0053893733 /DNA_START=124 /DNA_END=2211 /DNA_ORIENTATION=-
MRGFHGLKWLAVWAALLLLTVPTVLAQEEDGTCAADDASCGADAADTTPEEVKHQDVAEDGIAEDIHLMCPLSRTKVRDIFRHFLEWCSKQTWFAKLVWLWPKDVDRDNWADDYITLTFIIVNRLLLGLYTTRDKSYLNVPTERSSGDDLIRVENIHAPHWDVDGTPNFFAFEWLMPKFVLKYMYTPMVTCFYSTLRRLGTDTGELNGTFADNLDDPMTNTWDVVLKDFEDKSKVNWVMKFYDISHTWDNNPLWPRQMTDFQQFYKEDMWDDMTEHAIAFHLIGTHRVEYGSWTFSDIPGLDTVSYPYRVPLNLFSIFDVRPHFGKYGADMYFDQDGMPVLVVTPNKEYITRGSKHWQYWKFVWRSTFITGITLVDHLHITHFRTGNLMARATREALPPDFPLRRITSIFTFGSIFVNLQAMHTLVGPNHMLHRATPFTEFTKISNVVPSADSQLVADIPDIPSIKKLINQTEFDGMPELLRKSPFYADSVMLMTAIRKLANNIFDATWIEGVCNSDGSYSPALIKLRDTIAQETMEAHYALNGLGKRFLFPGVLEEANCHDGHFKRMMIERMSTYFFIVTGWHKHVGFVGDYYKDPELATMSWREGERWGRPKQHMIMTVINVFTSTQQPLLREDFSHLFEGMKPDLKTEYTAIWKEFQSDLDKIGEVVDGRNEKRRIPNYNIHPKVLESAVSK